MERRGTAGVVSLNRYRVRVLCTCIYDLYVAVASLTRMFVPLDNERRGGGDHLYEKAWSISYTIFVHHPGEVRVEMIFPSGKLSRVTRLEPSERSMYGYAEEFATWPFQTVNAGGGLI